MFSLHFARVAPRLETSRRAARAKFHENITAQDGSVVRNYDSATRKSRMENRKGTKRHKCGHSDLDQSTLLAASRFKTIRIKSVKSLVLRNFCRSA